MLTLPQDKKKAAIWQPFFICLFVVFSFFFKSNCSPA